MASMTTVVCGNVNCRKTFQARTADVARGWGKFCSKSCKAKKQTWETGITGPDYKAEGRTVTQMKNGKFTKSRFVSGRSGRKPPWDVAGVDKDTYLYYANEYGGIPQFDRRGYYTGMIPDPFDNGQDHQNSDPY